MLMNYWRVTKPGIVFGNLVSIMGGFFLAARGHLDIVLLLSAGIGISLVIASACVLNNCVDRDVDRLMSRTRGRVLARGLMSPNAALLYASVLCAGGVALLISAHSFLAIVIVLFGLVIYAGVYSPLKRRSVYAPLIGSLAGAAPPLAGYCAVNNRFDIGAVILLLIFSLWQIPHFYAIAVFRLEDYVSAGIPILPVTQGVPATRRHIMGFILTFIVAAMLLTLCGYTGYGSLAVAITLGSAWFSIAWLGYTGTDVQRWGRSMFICSILTIFMLSMMMSVDFATSAR
jgi:protoheme IX farnesyltransferase